MAKALAIMNAYFQSFKEQLDALDKTAHDYEMWMLSAGQARLRSEPDYTSGFQEAFSPYAKRLTNLLVDLSEYAINEFQR